jgi:hypothetical protein
MNELEQQLEEWRKATGCDVPDEARSRLRSWREEAELSRYCCKERNKLRERVRELEAIVEAPHNHWTSHWDPKYQHSQGDCRPVCECRLDAHKDKLELVVRTMKKLEESVEALKRFTASVEAIGKPGAL